MLGPILHKKIVLFLQGDFIAPFLGQLPQFFSKGAVGGLFGQHRFDALFHKGFVKQPRLGGFAGTVDTFENEKQTFLFISG